MKTLAALAVLAGLLGAQSLGPAVNFLFPTNNNVSTTFRDLVVSADGSWVAVRGSLPAEADVLIAEVDRSGDPTQVVGVLFPGNNDVHATNGAIVASRQGRFLCCYGSNGSVGDLVFITRDATGAWIATNVLFPAANNSPNVGTRPVISDDEEFIVCRGLSGIADVVIVPVTSTGGIFTPGTPFNEIVPGGNSIPFQAADPVIAPNSLSFAVAGVDTLNGDLIVGTVAKPVSGANTTLANVAFPSGNNLLSVTVPPSASPLSNYYAAHGSFLNVGDLVVVAVDGAGVPDVVTNVGWPSNNNTASSATPPTISGDGRLVAVTGTGSNLGDVVLLPIDGSGLPGSPANVLFPAFNNVPNTALPPVVSPDAKLVLQRGAPTIGDLVAVQVTFTSATTITAAVQNVLYPGSNDVPSFGCHIALAPDRSFAATLGHPTIGDLVITPFDAAGQAAAPSNVLYPAFNNVPLTTTPRISREGLLVMTPGEALIGDAVVTGVEIDAASGLIEPTFTTNVLYPGQNNNYGSPAEPVFSPTTQFAVAAGSPTIGDLVFIPLLDPFPRFLARGDVGALVPVRFFSPLDAGRIAIGAAAFGRHPGTALPPPDGRVVPLNSDLLLAFSTTPLNPVFLTFAGFLDADGIYEGATIAVPPIPALHGFFIDVAFVVLDPAGPIGIGTISKPSVFLVE